MIRFGFPAKFPAQGWFRIPGASIFCYVRDFRPNSDFGRPNSDFEPAIFSLFSLRRELSLCMRSLIQSNLSRKIPNAKTNVQNSRRVKNWGPKYSKRQLMLNLKLAAP